MARRQWTTDELNVLVAIFMVGKFSIGDDERIECRIIADALGRSPSSVDRQWRNIAAILKGDTKSHIGNLVRDVLQSHLDDPVAGRRLAQRIAERNRWELQPLIQAGEASGTLSPASSPETLTIREQMLRSLSRLDYCIFPSGTHGFSLSADISTPDMRRYRCYMSCALIAPESPNCPANATVAKMRKEMEAAIGCATVQRLPSGSLSVAAHSRLELGRERFSVVIRLVQIDRGVSP